MPTELFEAYGRQPAQQPQNPQQQCRALMQQQGISVPETIANDPNAILQHLMQSGQIPQNRLQAARQMLSRMMGRR